MNIVGLGQAGCNIVDKFSNYPQYNIYKIDSTLPFLNDKNYYRLEERKDFEEYEKHAPDLQDFLKGIHGEVSFIVGGAGNVPGASLRILEYLKGCRINVLYVKPDVELLNKESINRERVLRGVMQEYSRSAVFDNICLIDNTKVEEALGDVPVMGYYDKLNDLIVSTRHMISVFQNTVPVISTHSAPLKVCRISTIGNVDVSTGEEKLFFSLDLIREKVYYYAISREKLKTDGTLSKKIKEQVKSKIEGNQKVSYGIYATDYEDDYAYCVAYTSKVQLDEKSLDKT